MANSNYIGCMHPLTYSVVTKDDHFVITTESPENAVRILQVLADEGITGKTEFDHTKQNPCEFILKTCADIPRILPGLMAKL